MSLKSQDGHFSEEWKRKQNWCHTHNIHLFKCVSSWVSQKIWGEKSAMCTLKKKIRRFVAAYCSINPAAD